MNATLWNDKTVNAATWLSNSLAYVAGGYDSTM